VVDELPVRDPVEARSRIDADDPKSAHVALAVPAVTIGIRHRVHDGFMCRLE